MMVVAVAVVAALALVLRMFLCLQIVRFPCFLKRRNGPTDGPTDRPSYRDARTHLKTAVALWVGRSVCRSAGLLEGSSIVGH